MRDLPFPRSAVARPASALVAVLLALGATAAAPVVPGLPLAPPAAHAADADVVFIPDANLKAKLNAKLGAGRPATQDITVAEAQSATGTLTVAGPTADLRGIEAFTNVTSVSLSGSTDATLNTFTSLQPLAGLTKLTSLNIASSGAESLAPLAGLTNLTSLTVDRSPVTDPSPLAPMASKLTLLDLTNDRVSDLTLLPSLPNVTNLRLGGNRIVDPAPVLGKIDATKLATLNLTSNRIADASSLVPLGSGKVGQWTSSSAGLLLQTNRITDFTPFDGWAKPPAFNQTASQQLYVGPYPVGGITLPVLKQSAAITDPLQVDPPTAGSYDPASRLLTVTDPATASVTLSSSVPGSGLSPRFVVTFSDPPSAPDEVTGPTVGGLAQIGAVLTVSAVGPAMASCPSSSVQYRWLRDGGPITGVAHAADSHADALGAPGVGPRYVISATDVGHRLSLQLTCADTGATSTSAPTAVVTATEPQQPVIQSGEFLTGLDFSGVFPAGVVGDPTNPSSSIYVAQLDAANQLVDPAGLVVTASVSYQAGDAVTHPIEASDVHITGTGAERTIAITPKAATPSQGTANVTLTVTGTTGKTSSYTFPYVASRQTTPTSRVLLGSSDASTAIAVGDGYLLVADDETAPIRLYDGDVSGREVGQFLPGFSSSYGEIDFEASARKGDAIWWLGSHGLTKKLESEASRFAVYETKLTGSGASAKLTPTGVVYTNLRSDMVNWDRGRLGLSSAKVRPDAINGFNIEGAEFSPDGSQLYVGLRAPIFPAQVGGKAIIVPVTNLEALTAGTATSATFADPILLDLGGDSIREIRKNDRGEYLILSAPAGTPDEQAGGPPQALWAWNGERGYAPRKLTTVIPTDVEPQHTDNAGAWEGIGEMPDRLAPGAPVRLIMDQGYDVLYGGLENKSESPVSGKARTDVVTLAGPAGTVAGLSGSGAFPVQAANTISAAKKVTVTNDGSNVLHVGRAYTEGADDDSANDFIVNNNTCTGAVLDPTQTCTLFVRFAPSRANTASTAQLVVESDQLGGRTTMALTGSSATLPAGPAGPAGSDGPKGDRGDDGVAGVKGDAGASGAPGASGSAGAKGDPGDPGTPGAPGPAGPQGAQGPSGPVTVDSASASGSRQPTIKVDAKGRLVVTLRNADDQALRIRVRARATIGGKRVTIATRTITLPAGRAAKVALTVDRAARRQLGRGRHDLEVTATPLTGADRTAGRLTGRVAVSAPGGGRR
jgi:Leucine-rich repeat (LRR) protein